MQRNINIIEDLEGNKIVVIHDVIFRGRKSIDWQEVKNYLEKYVGEFYEVLDT
ncbi:MAG: hypothetical protein R3Y58_11850 [Eubacteriales bacterium]